MPKIKYAILSPRKIIKQIANLEEQNRVLSQQIIEKLEKSIEIEKKIARKGEICKLSWYKAYFWLSHWFFMALSLKIIIWIKLQNEKWKELLSKYYGREDYIWIKQRTR